VLPRSTAAALIVGLAGCAVLGITAGPLSVLLEHAAATLGGIR
jgi:hypothetical protein